MPLHIVHHPDYDANFPADHRFPMGKYRALMGRCERRGLVATAPCTARRRAPASWLELAHDRAYVDQVIACQVPAADRARDRISPSASACRVRAQLATGGTLLAARLALAHGIACNTAGGSHHARRAQGAGFCTLERCRRWPRLCCSPNGLAERILVVDLDVHQGDGTADILRGEPRVFTFSMHGERNIPVRKIASSLDIALPDGPATPPISSGWRGAAELERDAGP